eukprot:2731415-Pleurochrysis_carterae.AAC.2
MKEGARHGELSSRKESLMAMEGDKLLLKAIHRATQVIRFDHFSPHAGARGEPALGERCSLRQARGISRVSGAHTGEHQQQHFAQQARFA